MTEAMRGIWTSGDVARLTGGRVIGPPWVATGLALDSRDVKAGDLFFALPGTADHGERFISDALMRGAVAAMTTDFSGDLPETSSLVFVDNVELGLAGLAQAARRRMVGSVIAVTGSSGKTSTREMIATAGEIFGVCHQSPASYNNFRGVPFSLAAMPEDADLGVFEVGMNHAGEITPLSKLLAPDCAVITGIGDAHIGELGSRDAIAHAKAEIFCGLTGRKICILPGDDDKIDLLQKLAKNAGCTEIYRFGEGRNGFEANLIGIQSARSGQDQLPCSTIRAEILGRTITWTLPVAGLHMARNSLAALLCIGVLAGSGERETLAEAANKLGHFTLPQGRGRIERLSLPGRRTITVIDDSYNANPQSVCAALQVLRNGFAGSRTLVALGDMLELGDDTEQLHMGLQTAIETSGVDKVYSCGTHMAMLMGSLPKSLYGGWGPTSSDLSPVVLNDLQDGDTLLIKGSFGMNMRQILEDLRISADSDTEIVAGEKNLQEGLGNAL